MGILVGLGPSDEISTVAEGSSTAHPTTASPSFMESKDSAGQLNYHIVGLSIENPCLLADRFLGLASGGLAATLRVGSLRRLS